MAWQVGQPALWRGQRIRANSGGRMTVEVGQVVSYQGQRHTVIRIAVDGGVWLQDDGMNVKRANAWELSAWKEAL